MSHIQIKKQCNLLSLPSKLEDNASISWRKGGGDHKHLLSDMGIDGEAAEEWINFKQTPRLKGIDILCCFDAARRKAV